MTRYAARVVAALCFASLGACATRMNLAWDSLPALPPAAGQTRQPGVASPFIGVHGGALLVAGGANFPEKMPWEGGAKRWWDDIWILENIGGTAPSWVTEKTFKLPRPIGYGISVSTPDGVICVGGSDAERCYADVFQLSWDSRAKELRRTTLPALPEPLAFMAGALVEQTLYVAGGQKVMKGATPTAVFWSLDLSQRDRPAEFKWLAQPGWPGPPRILPVAAAQRTASGMAFFLFSGRTPHPGQATEILSDAYAFDPQARTWKALPPIDARQRVSVMAGTAAAVGNHEIFLFGGDRGDLFLELEAHDLAIESLRKKLEASSAAERAGLEREIAGQLAAKQAIYESHPGFGREVFAFDTIRGEWRVVTTSPHPGQVTTIAVKSGEAIIIPSGEIRPGVRTPAITRVTPTGR